MFPPEPPFSLEVRFYTQPLAIEASDESTSFDFAPFAATRTVNELFILIENKALTATDGAREPIPAPCTHCKLLPSLKPAFQNVLKRVDSCT
jgi:hypothetical protein